MSDGLTQPGTRIDETLWAEFRDFVAERNGGVKGYLRQELEHALKNHMELSETGEGELHIELLRDEMQALREDVQALESDTPQKEKTNTGDTVQERAEQISQLIRSDFGTGPISETAIETAIREVAGGSAPTIRQYRRLLKSDFPLYDNPSPKPTRPFVFGDGEYAEAVQNFADMGVISQEEYNDAITDLGGEDRFRELIDADSETDPTYQ